LIVPDKLKGTLSAAQAARALARGWQKQRPQDLLDELPMADGGDGFGEVFGELMGAEPRACHSVDAHGRPRSVQWWATSDTQLALFETAQVNGLKGFEDPAPELRPHPSNCTPMGLVL
jgi:glycerate kinase